VVSTAASELTSDINGLDWLDLSVDLRDVVGDRLLLSGGFRREGVSEPFRDGTCSLTVFLHRQTLMFHMQLH